VSDGLPTPQAPDLSPAINSIAKLIDGATAIITATGGDAEKIKTATQAIQGLLDSLGTSVAGMLDKVKEIVTAAPQIPAAPLVDPEATLKALAQAINTAEGLLNSPGGLAIFSGSVEAEFNVALPGATGGARAKIVLEIKPQQRA
jgi:hypothetical protein